MKHFLLAGFLPASDQRAARQSLWLGAIMAVQLLTALAQLSLSARILGPDGLGALFTIIAITSLLFGLLTLPGEEVIITHVTRSLAEGRREEAARILRYTLGAALGMRLVGYGLIVLVAPVVGDLLAGKLADWYRALFNMVPAADGGLIGAEVDYVTPTLVYAVSGILSSMSGETLAVLRLADRLHLGFAATVAGALARVAVLAAALMTSGGLLMVTLASVAGTGVLGVALFLAMMASLRQAGLSELPRSLSVIVPRDVIRFQIANFGRSAVEALNRHIDVLLIVGLTSVTQLGLYRAAHQIVDAARRPFEALAQGVQREYSRFWFSSNGTTVRKLALRFTSLAVALGALGYALLAMLHQLVIRIILGPDFTDAASPLLVMIPGGFVFACVAALYVLPAATGRAMPHFASISVALVAQVIALIALTPTYGANGTALASTIYFLAFAAVITPFAFTTLRRGYRNPAGTGVATFVIKEKSEC